MRRLILTLLVFAAACAGHSVDRAALVNRAAAATRHAGTAAVHVEVTTGQAQAAADGMVDFVHKAESTPSMRRIGDAVYVLASDRPTWLAVDLDESSPGDPLQSATLDALATTASAQSLGTGGYRAAGVDVWLDGAGRIRRIVRHVGAGTITVDYRNFGRPVDIAAPTVAEDLRGASPDA